MFKKEYQKQGHQEDQWIIWIEELSNYPLNPYWKAQLFPIQ